MLIIINLNCQPEIVNNREIIRPAMQTIIKNYYTTGSAYLKSRVKHSSKINYLAKQIIII